MEDDGTQLLQEAAWQVYAVPPAEFVPTRTAWVRRLRGEGHKETAKAVNALRNALAWTIFSAETELAPGTRAVGPVTKRVCSVLPPKPPPTGGTSSST